MPPLPPRPVVKPHDAESKSKKQLGNSSKVLIADEFYKDCKSLERLVCGVVCGVVCCVVCGIVCGVVCQFSIIDIFVWFVAVLCACAKQACRANWDVLFGSHETSIDHVHS